MNYRQWCGHADQRRIKRLTWCHGAETVLREELVTTLTRSITPPTDPDIEVRSVDLSRQPNAVLFDHLRHYPLRTGTVRLVVARHAESLTDWSGLLTWLSQSRALPGAFLVAVSDADTAPDALHGAGSRAHVVRCVRPSQRDLAWWARRWAPVLHEDTADHLAARLGGDLARLRDFCRMMALLEVNPTPRQIRLLCAPRPAETFVELVLALRRAEALAAADEVDIQEYRAVVGLLAVRLPVLEQLHHAVRAELSRQQIAALPDVPYFLANQFLPVAQHYPPERCARRRTALAVLDAAVAAGARDGVLDTLVAQWT